MLFEYLDCGRSEVVYSTVARGLNLDFLALGFGLI
jgi:hypothetical protein